jgi:hypothetical protein
MESIAVRQAAELPTNNQRRKLATGVAANRVFPDEDVVRGSKQNPQAPISVVRSWTLPFGNGHSSLLRHS